MKAYFIVIKWADTNFKDFCHIGVDDMGNDTQFTTSREVAENLLSRMMTIYGPQGHEYELHEVTV